MLSSEAGDLAEVPNDLLADSDVMRRVSLVMNPSRVSTGWEISIVDVASRNQPFGCLEDGCHYPGRMSLFGNWGKASSKPAATPSRPAQPSPAATCVSTTKTAQVPATAAEFPPAHDLTAVPRSCQEVNRVLVAYRHTPISAALHTIGQKHSMLHLDVLTLLYHFARTCEGQILEIGPYVGGSTIALARGARESGQPGKRITTIEPGGAFEQHPVLPSADILGDLRRNLEKRGVSDTVEVLAGLSTDPAIVERVHRDLGLRSVGLLMIDADGEIHGHLDRYRDLLTKDCYVVLDDYYGPGEKSAPTSRQVEELVARGEFVSYGLYGWGTWVGRRNGAPGSTA